MISHELLHCFFGTRIGERLATPIPELRQRPTKCWIKMRWRRPLTDRKSFRPQCWHSTGVADILSKQLQNVRQKFWHCFRPTQWQAYQNSSDRQKHARRVCMHCPHCGNDTPTRMELTQQVAQNSKHASNLVSGCTHASVLLAPRLA